MESLCLDCIRLIESNFNGYVHACFQDVLDCKQCKLCMTICSLLGINSIRQIQEKSSGSSYCRVQSRASSMVWVGMKDDAGEALAKAELELTISWNSGVKTLYCSLCTDSGS